MNRRNVTLVVGAVDAIVCAAIAVAALTSRSDPATKGLDEAAGWAVTALFLVTGMPALVLAWRRRAPVTAFILAFAFLAVFAALFIAVPLALP
jgi:predicted benzoate:H+ symporter BenE